MDKFQIIFHLTLGIFFFFLGTGLYKTKTQNKEGFSSNKKLLFLIAGILLILSGLIRHFWQ